MNSTVAQGNMARMTELGARWWNDSCDLTELADAVRHGAVGATSNPIIVSTAIQNDPGRWLPVIRRLIQDDPAAIEDQIAWKLIAEIGRHAAGILRPIFESTQGEDGFLSLQVNPKFYPCSQRMTDHGIELAALAPNIAIKVPATQAGLEAVEALTARGIRVNVTVSFTVAQAMASAEAIERGLKQARQNGLQADAQRPYVTLMEGRLDDYLKQVRERDRVVISGDALEWAGVAVFKKTAALFRARGYQSTLLAAAYRNVHHWSEIIGPNVLQSIPYGKWKEYNQTEIRVRSSLEIPVARAALKELLQKLPEFGRAYDEDGIAPRDFVRFGAARHTLRQFNEGYAQLLALIRNEMLSE